MNNKQQKDGKKADLNERWQNDKYEEMYGRKDSEGNDNQFQNVQSQGGMKKQNQNIGSTSMGNGSNNQNVQNKQQRNGNNGINQYEKKQNNKYLSGTQINQQFNNERRGNNNNNSNNNGNGNNGGSYNGNDYSRGGGKQKQYKNSYDNIENNMGNQRRNHQNNNFIYIQQEDSRYNGNGNYNNNSFGQYPGNNANKGKYQGNNNLQNQYNYNRQEISHSISSSSSSQNNSSKSEKIVFEIKIKEGPESQKIEILEKEIETNLNEILEQHTKQIKQEILHTPFKINFCNILKNNSKNQAIKEILEKEINLLLDKYSIEKKRFEEFIIKYNEEN